MELEQQRGAAPLIACPSNAGVETAETQSGEIQPPAYDPSAVVGMDDACDEVKELKLPFRFLVFV